jgi:hypothetical protein
VRWLSRVVRDLRAGRGVDVYVAILLAVVIAALDIFGVASTQVISATTLAVLALLASSVVSGQRQVTALETDLQAFSSASRQLLTGRPSAEAFFVARRERREHELATASEVDLLGVTLSRVVREQATAISRRLEQGAHIRVLMIDPTSDAVTQAALRSWADVTGDFYLNRLRPTVDMLRVLSQAPAATGRLELRMIPYVPTFGLQLLNRSSGHATVFVELYPHKSSGGPEFEIVQENDPHWYGFFAGQFEVMWQVGRVATAADGFVDP